MRDYLSWHKIKSNIENGERNVLFHDREIWWCSLGANIGFEQDGKHGKYERPVLVFRKFNKEMFWGIPLTSREKDNKFYYKLTINITNKNKMVVAKTSRAILSQLRLLSDKRLIRRIARINEDVFREIENKIIELIMEKE